MSFSISNYQLWLNDQPLFSPISFLAEKGQTVAITGPSGSGKSTILSDISGVLAPAFKSVGDVELNGQNLRPLPIEQRKVGILFQDDLLFPHLNVFENLVFGVPRTFSREEKVDRIQRALSNANLSDYEHRDIATLSGGQRSRIALLRTLLSEPNLILLDEPFSKLDKALKLQFKTWVFEQLAKQNIPAILVTHDEDDIPEGSETIQLEPLNA